MGVRNKAEMFLGLKEENGLETEYWVVVDGKPSAVAHFLVLLFAEDSLQKLSRCALS